MGDFSFRMVASAHDCRVRNRAQDAPRRYWLVREPIGPALCLDGRLYHRDDHHGALLLHRSDRMGAEILCPFIDGWNPGGLGGRLLGDL